MLYLFICVFVTWISPVITPPHCIAMGLWVLYTRESAPWQLVQSLPCKSRSLTTLVNSPSFNYKIVWDSSAQPTAKVANEVKLTIYLTFERREEMLGRDFALLWQKCLRCWKSKLLFCSYHGKSVGHVLLPWKCSMWIPEIRKISGPSSKTIVLFIVKGCSSCLTLGTWRM